MTCPHCGREIPDGVRFCAHCGNPIALPVTPGVALAGASAPAPTPPYPRAAPPMPASARAGRTVGTALLVTGIACMVVGLIGTILWTVGEPDYNEDLYSLLLRLMPSLWTPGPVLIAIGWSLLTILKAIHWESAAAAAARVPAPTQPSQYP